MKNRIINMDCIEGLKTLDDESVNCCITSPPYWGLRDYGIEGQFGLEETPEEYVKNLVDVFEECKRVLRDDGTLWLNLGDSYAAGPRNRTPEQATRNSSLNGGFATQEQSLKQQNKIVEGLKPKDLVGIPWMVAFALRSAGWYLRQDIIWHKPNPMPESVTDRCTKSHEYIFLLSKSRKYYFDHTAIKKPMAESSFSRLSQDIEQQGGSDRVPGKTNGRMKAVGQFIGGKKHKNMQVAGKKPNSFHKTRNDNGEEWKNSDGLANKRSVWSVTTKPFKEAHFATFPEDLIIDCIKAGCPEGGVVLDPFMGAGTTALVSKKLNRNYIGFELNPEYIRIAEKRLRDELGVFY